MIKFEYSAEYILEDDNALLSPLKVEHISRLVDISNENNLWTFILEKGNGLDNLTKYIKAAIRNRALKKEYPFIVFDKTKNQFAGITRFYEYSDVLKTIKLGHTWYGQEFRGTGLNKHCKYLLFDFAFEKLGIERIGFGVHEDNKTSIEALKSVGCSKEGVLRSFIPSLDNKGRADIILFSILKNEWFNSKRSVLKYKLNTKK